jgi:EmrB/QacA subfamily drug resistance transporter
VTSDRRAVHPTVILLIACMAQFMVILDVSIVNVALPSIRTALHFSENDLQWVVSAYTVTFAGFLMLGGRAGDLLGRKRMFIVGVTVFSLASLLGALAGSSAMLVAARGLQGLGGAIVAPATLSIITTTFAEGPARNKALGVWGAVAAGGGSAGALFGGILTDALSWRWILLVNVPIGAVLVPVAWRYITESKGSLEHRHFDLAGAVTITAGLVALVLGIVNIEQYGWGSVEVIGGIGAGAVLLALFVLIEERWAKAPLVPLSIFRSRTLTGANVVVGLMGAAMFALWYFLSLYLQQVLGLSALEAGLAFLPMTGTLAVTATIAPKVIARTGGRTTLVVGMLLIAVGALWFTQISATGSWAADVLAPSVITALGMGLSFVPVTIAAVAGVPPERAGLASGLVNTSRQMGGALGLAVLVSLSASLTKSYVTDHPGIGELNGDALVHGYQGAFLLAAALALVGSLAALVLLPKLRAPRPADVPPAPATTPGEGAAAVEELV